MCARANDHDALFDAFIRRKIESIQGLEEVKEPIQVPESGSEQVKVPLPTSKETEVLEDSSDDDVFFDVFDESKAEEIRASTEVTEAKKTGDEVLQAVVDDHAVWKMQEEELLASNRESDEAFATIFSQRAKETQDDEFKHKQELHLLVKEQETHWVKSDGQPMQVKTSATSVAPPSIVSDNERLDQLLAEEVRLLDDLKALDPQKDKAVRTVIWAKIQSIYRQRNYVANYPAIRKAELVIVARACRTPQIVVVRATAADLSAPVNSKRYPHDEYTFSNMPDDCSLVS